MSRFRTYGPSDDVPLLDGDSFWTGFSSRIQPTALAAGIASYAGNMRFDRGTAKVRKGSKALSTDISLSSPPLVLDFTLAADVAVSSITRASSTATVTTSTDHGYTTGDTVNIRGADQADYNGDFIINVTGSTTFTYTVDNSPASPATGTIYANAGPLVKENYDSEVRAACVFANSDNLEGILIAAADQAYVYRDGLSTQIIAYPTDEAIEATDEADVVQFMGKVYLVRGYKQADPFTASTLTQTSGTATFTATAAHGLATGDWVWIKGASPVDYNGFFEVTVTSSTAFTYTVASSAASPATDMPTGRKAKRPLSWDLDTGNDFVHVTTGAYTVGLVRLPPVDWMAVANDRLVIPYERDQVLVSDSFDAETFDTVYTQFRILPGTNDWLVGAHPFQENKILIFYRKSIHALAINPQDMAISEALQITPQVGCVARQTITTCGDFILWLSDNGIYQMQIGDLLALRGAQMPLSDPIQDQLDSINWAYADKAQAVYFNNRYFLAVPLNDSTKNNAVFVYNFINQKWESIDTYPAGFDVLRFAVTDYSGQKRLHAVTTYGYTYLLEENEADEWGLTSSQTETQITGQLYTRNYLAGTHDMKRFKRGQLDANMAAGDAFTAVWESENPDHERTCLNAAELDAEDKTYRFTIGSRGMNGRLKITTSNGRPEFTKLIVEAAETGRKTQSYS